MEKKPCEISGKEGSPHPFAKKRVKIPPEMQKRIEDMAYTTWQAIGGDILDALGGEKNHPRIRRSEVVEIVCDADHMKTYGEDEEAYKFWSELPWGQRSSCIRKAFPCQWYGY